MDDKFSAQIDGELNLPTEKIKTMGQLNPALQFSELSNKKGSNQTRVLR
ncbi:MAG: hypothetical protein LC437_09830 [Thiohalomonas sp.]|nr:hypothetical protein [Thiohalomonas sp.]